MVGPCYTMEGYALVSLDLYSVLLLLFFYDIYRGEVINGGFGLVLDGSQVSDSHQHVLYSVYLNCKLLSGRNRILLSLCFQKTAEWAKSMLSWDVCNGVSVLADFITSKGSFSKSFMNLWLVLYFLCLTGCTTLLVGEQICRRNYLPHHETQWETEGDAALSHRGCQHPGQSSAAPTVTATQNEVCLPASPTAVGNTNNLSYALASPSSFKLLRLWAGTEWMPLVTE